VEKLVNEKIENYLRQDQYRIEDGGDGIFVVLNYEPTKAEQSKIVDTAKLFYGDVQWCPDPESHEDENIEDDVVYAVLNCFYPVQG
jgi:hypothetical protein